MRWEARCKTALGSPLQNNDTIASFIAAGDAGGDFQQAGQIFFVSAGDWSTAGGRSAEMRVNFRHEDTTWTRLFVRSDGRVQVPGISTTAAGANAVLDGANQNNLLRSTSSERYKREIEPVEPARSDAILALEPIWYRSTASADRPDWSWYGLIAEDVAKVEPRLVHYGYHDEDYELVLEQVEEGADPALRRVLKRGAELKPDGVQYDRLAVLLLDVVKRQEARIAALEARLRLGGLRPLSERLAEGLDEGQAKASARGATSRHERRTARAPRAATASAVLRHDS